MNLKSQAFLVGLFFFVAPTVIYAQPANDECANAVLLTSSTSCVTTAGTNVNATWNPTSFTPGCGATNKLDVWYKFVAQSSTQTITVSSAPSQVRLELFSGTCGSLTSIACGNTSIISTSLTTGNTYYIRVYTQNSNTGSFNICVTHAPPVNDDCSAAVSLTSNTSCINTAGTLNLATANVTTPLGCFAAGTYYDVWYSFVAANTTETVTVSGLGANITNPQIQIYGGTCGSLTNLSACGNTSITKSGLTVGTTYYIRVGNMGTNPSGTGSVANFNICVTHVPPANDNCSGAISLTSGTTCVNTAGTLVGATYTNIPTIGCGVANRNDVWYSFVAVSANTTITLSSAPANPRIQLFSGSCGSLTPVACGTSSLASTNLVVGNTYYVRVYTDPNVLSGTFNICVTHTPPTNDNCAGAISLNSLTTCVNIAGTLNLATPNATTPLGCFGAGTYYDVWYTFVAAATTETVTLSSLGANITSPQIQLYTGTCAVLTSVATSCGTTSITKSGLTIGTTYYVRVANLNSDPSGTGTSASFNICVTHAGLANDQCAGAILLTSGTTCTTTHGDLTGATYTASSIPAGNCTGAANPDVWYSFIAQTSNPTIKSSNGTNRQRIELFSGSCGTFTSIACGSGVNASISPTNLTIGNTYYIRVTTSNNSALTFDICVQDPAVASVVDYSKSYINVTKLNTGGSVEPGDILEIRTTFVVKAGTVDSVAFYDTLQSNSGFTLLSSTIATQTNEGKIFRNDNPVKTAFTDALDGDAGWYGVNGADTTVQINMGTGASGTKRGTLSNTSHPSFYSSTCIIMATYRVQVYAGYNTKINWGGGAITYKDRTTGIMSTISFPNDSLVVYISPGLCASTVSTVNKVGIESDGTFGTPTNPAPLLRNRGASVAVPGYTYTNFQTTTNPNHPQDYEYGVANNTSGNAGGYTAINTWPKSDPATPSHRIHGVWDIIGDHTGAANTAKGNPPCDTTQIMSATNPCGYMLVVNAAYKTDTAFKSTITNLCPNTYYEISAWVRNICYKCGCDSTGKGSSSVGYIPFAQGDSSGVPPNLAFQINGQDYYTTGNIYYTGTDISGNYDTTQQGSDTLNRWVKRGFVYKTEPNQTSFQFLIRNNAPGGGGNDWAMDDIGVVTCLPVMSYSPSTNPTICQENAQTIYDTVRSTYENYTYYKWQRKAAGSGTWSDLSGGSGTISPFWNGNAWEYTASYTIPATNTTQADSADQYRMIVATTASNLTDVNCQFTEAVNIITTKVIDCGPLLSVDLLSFRGKLNENKNADLLWVTSKEDESVIYRVEKSINGTNFKSIAIVNSHGGNDETNYYQFTDPAPVTGKVWYRIAIMSKNQTDLKKYSRTILLEDKTNVFGLTNVINPFSDKLEFEVSASENSKIDATLINISGKAVRKVSFIVYGGANGLTIPNTKSLPAGMYILQIRNGDQAIIKKVMKK